MMTGVISLAIFIKLVKQVTIDPGNVGNDIVLIAFI